jgi:hypothetical protein
VSDLKNEKENRKSMKEEKKLLNKKNQDKKGKSMEK